MGVFEDQKAQLQARMQSVNDRIAAKRLELQRLQDEKAGIAADLADLRAAYQAWKGTQL